MTQTDDPIPVLLVDDLEENLLALEALLRRDGLTFLKARTGDEALELLLAHEVALALLDVQMPGMDGFELLARLRERSPAVLALLDGDPFDGTPPAALRWRLDDYRFTDPAERTANGDWWKRTLLHEEQVR